MVGGVVAARDITSLKRLYPETALMSAGRAACVIVTPAGDVEARQVAEKLAERLQTASSEAPEIVEDAVLVSRWWEIDQAAVGERQIVALGNINNNRLIALLWGQGYVAEDGVFPGKGGHSVRTVHDPFARGINVVVLVADESAGLARAADDLWTQVAAEPAADRVIRGPLVIVRPGDPVEVYAGVPAEGIRPPGRSFPRPEEFAADLGRRVGAQVSRARDEAEARRPTLVNVTAVLAQLAEAWFYTGDEGYPPLMKRLVDGHRDLLQVVPRRVEMEGASADHMIWWDLVEELPVWTDEDRLTVTNAFLSDALQGHEPSPAHQLVKSGAVQVVLENHGTNSGLHTHNHWRYFAKYYDLPEEAYWTSVVTAIFQGQLASHQVLEDSSTYLISAPEDAEQHAMRSGDLRFFRTGIARTQMEFILQCSFSNLGLSTGFGDAQFLTYASGWNTVARMGWLLRDPRAAWWWRHYLSGRCGLDPYQPGLPVDDAVGLGEPVEWTGLQVFPLHRQPLTRGQSSPVVITAPGDPVGPEWFNKAVFREAWSPEAQYLLLDGAGVEEPLPGEPPGPNGHRHEDVNTIITFSDLGRMWLVDHTYAERGIEQHSGLTIARDGEFDYRLHQARLLNAADGGALAVTRSLFTDYSGADWERAIFWRKGDHFVVLDRVTARAEGDFAVRANFRSLGVPDLRSDGELRLEQAGRFFQIRPEGRPESALRAYRFPYEETWRTHYPHAEPVAQVLEQDRRARLTAGESMNFANLLRAAPTAAELDRAALRRVGLQSFAVSAGGEKLVYGIGSPTGAEIDCEAHLLGAEEFLLAGVRRIGPPEAPVFASVEKVDLWRSGEDVFFRTAGSVKETARRLDAAPAEKIIRLTAGIRHRALLTATPQEGTAAEALPASGPVLPSVDVRLSGPVQRVARADLDGDGLAEWIATGPAGVTASRADGSLLWRSDAGVPAGALAVGDVDGDGRPEIVAGDDANRVHLLDAGGLNRWSYTCLPTDRANPPVPDQIELTDLDGDNRPEILVAANYLHCLSADGSVRWEDFWEFRRGRRVGDVRAFAVSDYNRDGRPEIMTVIDLNYPVALGYNAVGERVYPADPAKQRRHSAIRVNPPQAVLLADLFGDGGNEQIVVGATDRLNIRWAGGAHDAERAADLPGGRVALALAARAGERPFLYTASDLGAVLAYQASGNRDEAGGLGLAVRWRQIVGGRITTLWAGTPREHPLLVVGLRSGEVRVLDGGTGRSLGASPARAASVVQILPDGASVAVAFADGLIRIIRLPE
jgi:hypothetical protein